MQDRALERFFSSLFLLYILLSLYGAAWISDEFDQERAVVYGFFAIPLTIFFFSFGYFVPAWRRRWPLLHQGCIALLGFTHLWGNLLLLNRIGGQDKHLVRMAVVEQPMNLTYKLGGFGWLYQERW